MANTIEVRSDGIHYWLRWGAMLFGVGVLWIVENSTQDWQITEVHSTLFVIMAVGIVFFSIKHRPKSFRLTLKDDELKVESLPGGRVVGAYPVKDLRYATVRNAGHLLNLSVLNVVIRTKKSGSRLYGPIYVNGVDTVTSAEVGRMLPRIARL